VGIQSKCKYKCIQTTSEYIFTDTITENLDYKANSAYMYLYKCIGEYNAFILLLNIKCFVRALFIFLLFQTFGTNISKNI